MTYRKKLIEVALPLEAINAESAREKSIRHGHPSTLHLWWARRPLATCRAVLFSQMVDDPSSHPELFPTEKEQTIERERLFDIIRDLVLWENVNNETVLEKARVEIRRWAPPEGLPPVLDPFAGGGSIPLEAQRLGLEAHASDLNPVAVLINKALIEIPPKFANLPPVNPESRSKQRTVEVWHGAQGLAEDVRHYGQWMRDEAEKRIGHLYPKVTITDDLMTERSDLRQKGLQAGDELTVIAWLWARTVISPNPAANGAHVPLVRSFWLSTKPGKKTWVEPVINRQKMTYCFEIRTGNDKPELEGTVERTGGTCLLTNSPMPFPYIREQGQAGNMHVRLMAIVAEGSSGRIYLAPDDEQIKIANSARPDWRPEAELPHNPRDFKTPNYGMRTFGELFTDRQLVALTTFSDLVGEARPFIVQAALAAGWDEERAEGYGTAVATYLAFGVDKNALTNCTLATWQSNPDRLTQAMSRQALPMTWDYAEANPLSNAGGGYVLTPQSIAEVLEKLPITSHACTSGYVEQRSATEPPSKDYLCISTDPPYYDNIGYADLSDFFYVWLRRSISNLYPDLFRTLLVPKSQELVATAYRFDGDRSKAQAFFEEGLQHAFNQMQQKTHPLYPLTVYYAFKQAESGQEGTVSTGWETMLEGLMSAGFSITGTWPMRTELITSLKKSMGALASSVVISCRPRPTDAPRATRRDFLNALRRELPAALRDLQKGNIAPVDMAQASIGPGMAIFSRYSQILEADGSAMRVRTALALINQALDEYLSEQEGAYDTDTRWALAWFEQNGFQEGPYGDAETLSTAKNTSVSGMVSAGFLQAGGGKVRLLRRAELPADWNPQTDKRLTVWEVCQQLIRTMEEKGETAAAQLLVDAGQIGEAARDLAYRLYQICERKGWAQEALPYNALVVSWSEMGKLSREVETTPTQRGFNF